VCRVRRMGGEARGRRRDRGPSGTKLGGPDARAGGGGSRRFEAHVEVTHQTCHPHEWSPPVRSGSPTVRAAQRRTRPRGRRVRGAAPHPRVSSTRIQISVSFALGGWARTISWSFRGVKRGTREIIQVRPAPGEWDKRHHFQFADLRQPPGSSRDVGCGEKHGGGGQDVEKKAQPVWGAELLRNKSSCSRVRFTISRSEADRKTLSGDLGAGPSERSAPARGSTRPDRPGRVGIPDLGSQ
jgi:hypothetical protein